MIRHELTKKQNLPALAWVSIGLGMAFLIVGVPVPAAGAFIVGACFAIGGRSAR